MPVLLRAMRSNERVSYFNEHAWLGYADIYARPTKNCIYNSTTRLHQLGEAGKPQQKFRDGNSARRCIFSRSCLHLSKHEI